MAQKQYAKEMEYNFYSPNHSLCIDTDKPMFSFINA